MRRAFAFLLLGLLTGGAVLAPVAQATQTDTEESPASEETVLGKRSSISFDATPTESVAVAEGTRLHAEAGHDKPVLATIRRATELAVQRREGEWVEVGYESFQGWVFAGRDTVARSLLDRPGWVIESSEDGSRRFAEAPVFSPKLTAARLKRLREFLGERQRELPFGPYTLYTDVRNDSLIEQLALTAATLEATYQERFGLELEAAEPQSVVLFAREQTYRSYEQEVPEISQLETLGHQSHGVAVTFVSTRGVGQIRRILLHELTHLLNRRALPLVLPSWLEEGLAEDLSFSKIDARGKLLAGSVMGKRERSLTEVKVSGGFASLASLLRSYRRPSWPRVSTLVDARWEEFVQPGARTSYYTQAAFFIRYLIDGRDGALADGFRDYLRQVADNGPDNADLWASLGSSREAIEKDYDVWIWKRGRAYGAVGERR